MSNGYSLMGGGYLIGPLWCTFFVNMSLGLLTHSITFCLMKGLIWFWNVAKWFCDVSNKMANWFDMNPLKCGCFLFEVTGANVYIPAPPLAGARHCWECHETTGLVHCSEVVTSPPLRYAVNGGEATVPPKQDVASFMPQCAATGRLWGDLSGCRGLSPQRWQTGIKTNKNKKKPY